MIEELQRRNFAATTIRTYVKSVEDFSLYFHRRSDQLGPGAYSPLSGEAVRQAKIQSQHRGSAAGLVALLLHQGVEAKLEHRRDALSEKADSAPADSQSGRGRTPYRCCASGPEFGFHECDARLYYQMRTRSSDFK
jgi:hypothetical protein